MSKEEKEEVMYFIDTLMRRINMAKEEIRQMNYGLALKTLSDAYPKLTISVDEESRG